MIENQLIVTKYRGGAMSLVSASVHFSVLYRTARTQYSQGFATKVLYFAGCSIGCTNETGSCPCIGCARKGKSPCLEGCKTE